MEVPAVIEGILAWGRASLPGSVLGYLDTTFRVFAVAALFLVLERSAPVEKAQPRDRIYFNLRWMLVYTTMTALIMGLAFDRVLPPVRDALGGPWFRLARPDTVGGYFLNWMAFFFVFDFFYYWFHRMQHAHSLLWSQHFLHHTERSLNATTTQRHHWLEEPMRLLAIGIPSASGSVGVSQARLSSSDS